MNTDSVTERDETERDEIVNAAYTDTIQDKEKDVMETVDIGTSDMGTHGIETDSIEMKSENQRTDAHSEQASAMQNVIFRHPTDKMLGGVCSGLADYLAWDPILMRVLWVVATLATGGGGFLAYLALWLLLPVGTVQQGQLRPPAVELNERNLGRAALVLISLGGLWLLSNLNILPWLWGGFWGVISIAFWPALLIGAGLLLLGGIKNRDMRVDLSDSLNRFKRRANDKMPSRGTMTGSLKEMRQRFPLQRSNSDRVIMGVCGGIAQRLGIDAILVRLIWAAFSVGSIGFGVLAYVVIGLLLPEDNGSRQPAYQSASYNDVQEVKIVDTTATSV